MSRKIKRQKIINQNSTFTKFTVTSIIISKNLIKVCDNFYLLDKSSLIVSKKDLTDFNYVLMLYYGGNELKTKNINDLTIYFEFVSKMKIIYGIYSISEKKK